MSYNQKKQEKLNQELLKIINKKDLSNIEYIKKLIETGADINIQLDRSFIYNIM